MGRRVANIALTVSIVNTDVKMKVAPTSLRGIRKRLRTRISERRRAGVKANLWMLLISSMLLDYLVLVHSTMMGPLTLATPIATRTLQKHLSLPFPLTERITVLPVTTPWLETLG
jgi:hypothetical protein